MGFEHFTDEQIIGRVSSIVLEESKEEDDKTHIRHILKGTFNIWRNKVMHLRKIQSQVKKRRTTQFRE